MPINAAGSAKFRSPGKYIHVDGQTLGVEEASKYLGVTLTNDLFWNKHVKSMATKGSTVNLCKTATLKKTTNWFSRPVIA